MASLPATAALNVDEFVRIHGQNDNYLHRWELIDGDVCPRGVAGAPHDLVKNNLKELFDRCGVDRGSFRCWIEHTFRIGNQIAFTPDVSIVSTERVLGHKGFTQGAPGNRV